jgi:hypothetical protein
MSSIRAVSVPAQEPVSIGEAQDYCKVPRGQDDALIAGLITAARTYAEACTSRSLASKDYVLTLDNFPYGTDTLAGSGYPISSYYSRYSTLWNYSQIVKLRYPPVTEVEQIVYIGTDGSPHNLFPGVDFLVDYSGEDCRLFPLPGATWPTCLYVPNAVAVYFTAGYDPDLTKVITIEATDPAGSPPVSPALPDPPRQQASITLAIGIPETARTAIMILVAHWYFQREPIVAGSVGTVPMHVDALLASEMVFDFAPTRG